MTRPNVYTIESGWWNFVRPIEAWNRSKYLSVKMAPSAGSNMANTPQRLPNFSSKLSPVSTTASFAALPSIREESLYRRIWGSSDGRIGYDKGWKKRRVCLFYKRHVLERGEDGGDDKNMGGKYRWNTSATPPTCFANSTFSSSILFPWISSEELNASLSKD